MTLQFIGTDQSGSSLLSQNKNLQTIFSYSPYGSTKERKQACPGFNSERSDPLTLASHLGNGYRAFSPTLMRFLCPDSLSPFGKGGINAYAYCDADPINHSDPSGHVKFRKWVTRILGLHRSSQEVSETAETTANSGGATGAVNARSTVSGAEAGGSRIEKQLSEFPLKNIAAYYPNRGKYLRQDGRDMACVFGFEYRPSPELNYRTKIRPCYWKGNFNLQGEDIINTHGVRDGDGHILTTQIDGSGNYRFASTAEEFIQHFQEMGVNLKANSHKNLHIFACEVSGSQLIQDISDALERPITTYGVPDLSVGKSFGVENDLLFSKPGSGRISGVLFGAGANAPGANPSDHILTGILSHTIYPSTW